MMREMKEKTALSPRGATASSSSSPTSPTTTATASTAGGSPLPSLQQRSMLVELESGRRHPRGNRKTPVEDDDSGSDSDERERRGSEGSHLASDSRTFINMFIAFLGSGILGLPFAFRHSGIVLGLVTLTFVASISTYAMLLVVRCKYKLRSRGIRVTQYGEIGFHAMGPIGKVLVDVALVISQSGFCVAYLIFIVTNAHQFLGIAKEVVVAVCVPPLIGFSLIRHMKELAYVALIADVMNFSGLAVVYTADLTYMAQDTGNVEVLGVLSSVPFFFGIASYCFEGVGMVLPLENAMENPKHFTPILICSVVILTTIYATFGVCGYLAFGDATRDVITLNMDDNGGLVTMIKLFLCVGLFFTYPLMLFPVFEVLRPIVLSGSSGQAPQSDRKDIVMRCCVVLITAVLAVAIPNFGQFISFIGSTCCSLLAFVLPASFYLKLFPDSTPVLLRLFLVGMIVLGVVAVSAGLFDGIKTILG